MTLKVVGAGLGRTSTHSLKLALEQLLEAPCYHMTEVFPRPEHVSLWHQGFLGTEPDWEALFEGFAAAVDWPVAGLWQEVAAAYPDALVLLSTRSSAEVWWKSYSLTILASMQLGPWPDDGGWYEMAQVMLKKFVSDPGDKAKCIAAYEAHNAAVRAAIPADRLIDWTAADGWGPLCEPLGLAEPDVPFPKTNTTEEFRKGSRLDDSAVV